MFEPLPLPATTPRPALPPATWLSDLVPPLIFGSIIAFLCFAGVATTLILAPGWRTSLLFVLLLVGVSLLGLKIRQKVLLRQQIYQHGSPISAQVTEQGRAFNPLKSSRDYTVWLQIQGPAGARLKITHPKADLWTAAPRGATLTGLVYEGNYLFAEALGRRFEVVGTSYPP